MYFSASDVSLVGESILDVLFLAVGDCGEVTAFVGGFRVGGGAGCGMGGGLGVVAPDFAVTSPRLPLLLPSPPVSGGGGGGGAADPGTPGAVVIPFNRAILQKVRQGMGFYLDTISL